MAASRDLVVIEETGIWRSYVAPIVVTMGFFTAVNAAFNTPKLGLFDILPQALPVFLGSSSVALVVLSRAFQAGRLTRQNAGLAISGWSAPKRLFGLVMILFFGYGSFASIEPGANKAPPPAPEIGEKTATHHLEEPAASKDAAAPLEPAWGDYCFWFVFLLPASLTELLVFVGVGFGLAEGFLRDRAIRPLLATGLAAVFASVAFGLFHYSYPPAFWSFVFFPLMPVMFLNICFFVITRNFYLTMLLHNAFAAVGFTELQYATSPPDPAADPATYQVHSVLMPVLVSFVLPFLFLHWLEARDVSDQQGQQH
jgi:hypothetical protein